MDSIMALMFLKTFIFPQKYRGTLPEIDWDAEEKDLRDQLRDIKDKDYKGIYAKEWLANNRMFQSVGKTEVATRLKRVIGELIE